jgi:hypothetical protein
MSIVLRPGGTHYVEVREGETVDFRYTSATRRDLLRNPTGHGPSLYSADEVHTRQQRLSQRADVTARY